MKITGYSLIILGAALFVAIWYLLASLDFSNMYVLQGIYSRGPSEAITYENLYRHTRHIS